RASPGAARTEPVGRLVLLFHRRCVHRCDGQCVVRRCDQTRSRRRLRVGEEGGGLRQAFVPTRDLAHIRGANFPSLCRSSHSLESRKSLVFTAFCELVARVAQGLLVKVQTLCTSRTVDHARSPCRRRTTTRQVWAESARGHARRDARGCDGWW